MLTENQKKNLVDCVDQILQDNQEVNGDIVLKIQNNKVVNIQGRVTVEFRKDFSRIQ